MYIRYSNGLAPTDLKLKAPKKTLIPHGVNDVEMSKIIEFHRCVLVDFEITQEGYIQSFVHFMCSVGTAKNCSKSVNHALVFLYYVSFIKGVLYKYVCHP